MEFNSIKQIFWSNIFSQDKDVEKNKLQFLKTVPFFKELSHWQLKQVSNVLYERNYDQDEFLFEEGQPGAALFIIVKGEVSVEIGRGQGKLMDTQLAVLESGAFLGELALLDQSPRSAYARALSPTTTLALFRADLNKLIKTEPEIACFIFRSLSSIIGERLKATNQFIHLKKGA